MTNYADILKHAFNAGEEINGVWVVTYSFSIADSIIEMEGYEPITAKQWTTTEIQSIKGCFMDFKITK